MSDTESSAVEFDREKVYPVLPLRDIVVFPSMIVPLFVGREKSVRALEEVMREDKHILVVTQKNAQEDDPEPDGIYEIGTIASVLQLLKLPDGTELTPEDCKHRHVIRFFRDGTPGERADADMRRDSTNTNYGTGSTSAGAAQAAAAVAK